MTRVDGAFLRDCARELVGIESVNPSLEESGSGEAGVADATEAIMAELGLETRRSEPRAGRPSVVGRLPGTGDGPSLMLNAHYDTVGVEGMEDPFGGRVRDGRLYGRGAYDMKGSLAACLAAAGALARSDTSLQGDLWVSAVADEEHASLGTRGLLEEGPLPDAAVVTEPTGLRPCVAHKGFVWMSVETRGRAAHGSRPDLGVDANLRMGRVLGEVAALAEELEARPGHPLVGPPSLHAATLHGGTGLSTYAAGCRLGLERRTVPGEGRDDAVREVRERLERVEREHGFEARLGVLLARPPFQAPPEAPVVRAVAGALEALGLDPEPVGEGPWTDAAFFADAGVDTVVLGPRGEGAHAEEEWVELDSLDALAEALVRTATAYCGARRPPPPPPDTSGRRGS